MLAVACALWTAAAPRLIAALPALQSTYFSVGSATPPDQAVAATDSAPIVPRFFIPSAGRSGNAVRVAQEVEDRRTLLVQIAFPERSPGAPTDPKQQIPTIPAFAAPEPYRTPKPPKISQAAEVQAARDVTQQNSALVVRASLRDRDRLLNPWPVAGLVGLASRPGAPPRAGPFAATL